jgi:glycosyltransferase involved in cell wall biosynthesis
MPSNAVDIIMPTYNPDLKLIRRAIASIIGQTRKDWRLFVVKDGGDADIQGVIEGLGDARISYYGLPHGGKAAALNFAISKGQAKYIAYLDDDDIWYPDHLETAIGFMSEKGVRFLHTDAHEVFVKAGGGEFSEVSRRRLNRGAISDKTLWYISHINVVHERSLMELAGGYDESKRFFIDWDMLIRLAEHARPHHLKVYTCEHYMYLDRGEKKSNIISGVHQKDPELSRKAHHEMFKRAFRLLTADDFAELAMECGSMSARQEGRRDAVLGTWPLRSVSRLFRKK